MITDFNNPLGLARGMIEQIKNHAVKEWPKESCGIVVNGHYLPQKNIADDPTAEFRMDPKLWLEYEIQGVIHSHPEPGCFPEPTKEDMQGQIGTAVPWGVVRCVKGCAFDPLWWGDYRLDQPLIGRKFVWCVQDCYALVRAQKWQEEQILLPDVPRNPKWIDEKKDIYRDSEPSLLTESVSRDALKVGDIIVFRFSSTYPVHFGVYRAGGLLLHHMVEQLSCTTPLSRYERFIDRVQRVLPPKALSNAA